MSTTWQLQVDWRRSGNWTDSITRITFENGSYTGDYNNGVPFKADDTVTGETSGAFGIIFGYHKTGGDWSAGTAVGYLDIAARSGDFSNGENLVASGPDTAVADYSADSQTAMGDYNAITSRVVEATWFVGQKKPYQDVADNSVLTLILDNSDQYFSPENSSSPIASKLSPLRPMRVVSDDGTEHQHVFFASQENICANGKAIQFTATLKPATGTAPAWGAVA